MNRVGRGICGNLVKLEDMNMIELDGAFAGWADKNTEYDSDISYLFAEGGDIVANFPYFLISVVDSSLSIDLSWPSLQEYVHSGGLSVAGDGSLLATREVVAQMARSEFFHGFDTIWACNQFTPGPAPARYVPVCIGPGLDADKLSQSAEWLETVRRMRTSGVALGFTHGIDINYITTNRTIAVQLDTLYNVQRHV